MSHLALYLEQIFEIVIREVFSQEYKDDMKEYVYYPTFKRAIEAPPLDISWSCNSSIASTNSANYTNSCLTNFGVLDFLDPDVSARFSFDLQHQITPLIVTDGRGILGNLEGDAATIISE